MRMCPSMCRCAHVRLGAVDALGAGVMGKCELPKCVSWEPDTGHQKEQQVSLTAEPSFQPATREILIIKTHFVYVLYAHLYFIRKRIEVTPPLAKNHFWLSCGSYS